MLKAARRTATIKKIIALLPILFLILVSCSKSAEPVGIGGNVSETGQVITGDEAGRTEGNTSIPASSGPKRAAPVESESKATIAKVGKRININDMFESILSESGVDDPAEIRELDLYEKGIEALVGIEKFPNLTVLKLTCNEIEDVSPLAKLNELETLLLGHNRLSSIGALRHLEKLQALYLHNNQLEVLIDFSVLKDLQVVTLENNQISDLRYFKNAVSLERLYLGSNLIRDVSPLEGLENLQVLSLYNNRITDITPLSSLVNISYLDLRDNMISDIRPLENMVLLENVKLRNNRITDISPLLTLCENGGLSGHKYEGLDYDIDLRGNDLDSNAEEIIGILVSKYNVRVKY